MDSNITNMIGLVGGLFFAYCGVPQAYKTIVAGKHLGTPLSISASITIGTVLMYLYLYFAHGFDTIITINYSVEFISWLVIFIFGIKDTFSGNK
jgi:hypothetical protein